MTLLNTLCISYGHIHRIISLRQRCLQGSFSFHNHLSTSHLTRFRWQQQDCPTYGHRHNLSALLYQRHTSHSDLSGQRHFSVRQEVFIHAGQLRSPLCWQHPIPSGNQHSNSPPHLQEARQGSAEVWVAIFSYEDYGKECGE